MAFDKGYRSTAAERRAAKAASDARIEERNRTMAAMSPADFLAAYAEMATIVDEGCIAWALNRRLELRARYGLGA